MVTFNQALSKEWKSRVIFEPRRCFKNSALVVLEVRGDSRYCEGYAIDHLGIPIEHGWVELGDDIIDVTWPVGGQFYETTRGYSYQDIVERVHLLKPFPFCVFADNLHTKHQESLLQIIRRWNDREVQ